MAVNLRTTCGDDLRRKFGLRRYEKLNRPLEHSITDASLMHKTAFNSAGRAPSEIVSLTSLRGLLALWIVLFHFQSDIMLLFPITSRLAPFMRVGHLAVPAFFMLSGFVLAYNYANRFNRLSKSEVVRFQCLRLARIYPVHLFTLLIVAMMVGVSRLAGFQLTDAGYTAQQFVLNLFLIHTWVPHFTLNWNYPSWSISSEWFAYLIFPLAVAAFLRHLTVPWRAALVGVTALLSSIAVMLWWSPLPFYELLLVVPTFFTGTAIYYWILHGREISSDSRAWRWLPEALAFAVFAFCFLPSSGLIITSLLCCFFALISILVWLGADCHAFWTARPFVFLGEVSYSLYMTHTLAQKMVYKLLPSSHFERAAPMTRLGVITVYAALVTIWCLLTYFGVEAPCRRLFKKAMRRSQS